MNRTLLLSVTTLTLASIAFANTDDLITTRRDDDLITTRRDDDLIEPLESRPAPSTLMRDVENARDRGDGRLQDEAMYELDQLENEIHGERMFDGFERDRDCQLFIDAQQRKQALNEPKAARVFERESDRLGAERRDYLNSVGRANAAAAAGAADDSKKLKSLKKDYEHDLKKLKTDAERDQRRERYERDRARILGVDPQTIRHDLTPAPPTTAASTKPSQ